MQAVGAGGWPASKVLTTKPRMNCRAALMRGDVLDQVVACGRWRYHRPDLQGTGFETRLWLRRVGLDDCLSRGRRGLSAGRIRVPHLGNVGRKRVMMPLARIRVFMLAITLLLFASIVPTIAQKLGPDGAPNPTASVTNQRTLLKHAPRVEGRIAIPDKKAGGMIQP